MRLVALAVVLPLFALWAHRGDCAPAPEDDPRLAATPSPAPPFTVDEDDPKLVVPVAPPKKPHPVPRFAIGYRQLTIAGLAGGQLTFHGGELNYFPVSSIARFGLSAEGGSGTEGSFDAWYFATGVSLGVQYPARVTPFLEGRFMAGLLGGSYQNTTAVSYIYSGGIEGGAQLYYADRFFILLALGWAHPVYSGIDVAWVMAHPGQDPQRKSFAADTFTFKVMLGL